MMTAINTNAPMTFEAVIKNIRIESETVLSIVSMSSENLFMIRPRGVVSKKLMGARITVAIALRWTPVLEANCVKRLTVAPEVKKVMVKETPRPA
jgi:DNA-binding Lrp family transcriptional regulator